jgi:hypothetical protein
MLEFQGISFIVTQEPLYPVSTQELLVVEEKLQVLFEPLIVIYENLAIG